MILRFGPSARMRPACLGTCAHCGLPAPAPCLREESEGSEGSEGRLIFCCRACRQVFELALELSATDWVHAKLASDERLLK